MKIIIDKNTNLVLYGFSDTETVTYSNIVTTDNYKILDLNESNSELIEGVIEPPTTVFAKLYKYEDSIWKLTWDSQKKISEVQKKCSELLLGDITGTEEKWTAYTDSLNNILDNLMISINPFFVTYPKKP
jgi:hypothetical protein